MGGDAAAALTAKGSAWRSIRIGFLLFVLAVASWSMWYDRLSTTDWDEPLRVGIFPVNPEGAGSSDEYIESLSREDFADIAAFLNEEARRHGITIAEAARVELFPEVAEKPPAREMDGSLLSNLWWSLRMRFYARRNARPAGRVPPQVRIFVQYHDPSFSRVVPHSVGLQKGLVGVVHAFAGREMAATNNVVIAHEILHTLGASDKYDFATLAPLFPSGYAEPERDPLHPQQFAEIMAGRFAVDAHTYEMPASLDDVVVGDATALEIRWIDP